MSVFILLTRTEESNTASEKTKSKLSNTIYLPYIVFVDIVSLSCFTLFVFPQVGLFAYSCDISRLY